MHSVVDALIDHAQRRPSETAFVFLEDGEREAAALSFSALDEAARRIGAGLVARGLANERALLLYPPGLEFVKAFFGCLYGGVLAVPAYPPASERGLPRLVAIAESAEPRIALTSSEILRLARGVAQKVPALSRLEWLELRDVNHDPSAWRPGFDGSSPAFLQYTSGSTSTPRGVVVSHANLLHNEQMIAGAFQATPSDVYVSWLPLFHDMGLIGQMIQSAFVGARCYLMAPTAFLEQPRRWLSTITRYRGTISGAPNFAYDLCARKIDEAQLSELDLSSWRLAFNGAEPVRAETLERFVRKFSRRGFKSHALYPCYGLAEATLMVSGGVASQTWRALSIDAAALGEGAAVEAATRESRVLVSCGRPLGGQRLCIVDPATQEEMGPGRVGEIWISGPSIAGGYWRAPESTAETFAASLAGRPKEAFLRTGDLGFLRDDQLFITGRAKDLIIVRGRNIYPQDLEATAERACPAVRPGCSAAFPVEVAGEEGIALVCELRKDASPDVGDVGRKIREAISREHDVAVDQLVFVTAGAVHKTSSGKVQRRATKNALQREGLEVIAAIQGGAEGRPTSARASSSTRAALLDMDPAKRASAIQLLLQDYVLRALRLSPLALAGDPTLNALGLDSLRAAELRHFLEQEMGAHVPLADLLQGLTISALGKRAAVLLEAGGEPVAPVTASSPFVGRLTGAQKSFWFEQQMVPDSPVYNMAGKVELEGALDVLRLHRAIERSIESHPMLRARFGQADGDPTCAVDEGASLCLPLVDLSSIDEREELEKRLVDESCGRAFDLESSPLFRAQLVRRGEGRHALVFVVHHIVADGWSMGVLLDEWRAHYAERPLDPQPDDREVVLAEEERVDEEKVQRSIAYWRAQLAGLQPSLDLPYDRPRWSATLTGGAVVDFVLDGETAASVRAFARAHRGTEYAVLLSAFVAFIHRLSGSSDIAVGTPVARRPGPEHRRVVAPLVNTVVIRASVNGQDSFERLVESVSQTAYQAFEHESVRLEVLARELQVARDGTLSPFFRVMFALENYPLSSGVDGGLAWDPRVLRDGGPSFDVTLALEDRGEVIRGRLHYNGSVFDRSTASRFLAQYSRMLAAVLGRPERPIDAIDLLGPGARAQISSESWTIEGQGPGPFARAWSPVEQWAKERPGATAIEEDARALSYRELDDRAGRLAHELARLGAGPGTIVACELASAIDRGVALGAIWKSGSVLLPLDPSAGIDRRRAIVEGSGARIIVARGAETAAGGLELVDLDCAERDGVVRTPSLDSRPSQRATGRTEKQHPAYLIYTSGSTGAPRGVVVGEAELAAFVSAIGRAYRLTSRDRVLQLASFGFDVSLEELLPTLAFGGCAVSVRSSDAIQALRLEQIVEERGLTVVNLPAQYFERWISEMRPRIGALSSLRLVITGSEEVSMASVRQWSERANPAIELRNVYGVTEAVVSSTSHRFHRVLDHVATIAPIGRSLGGVRIEILDRAGTLSPPGAPGELAIGGRISSGYLGSAARTAQRFSPDILDGRGGRRLYATGDLVRRLQDGSLAFEGRRDLQVKVRGVRVELAEIESALIAEPGVLDAAAASFPDSEGRPQIVGYVVPEPGGSFSRASTIARLEARLPRAMIPAALIALPRLPLLPNGKLDRRALPSATGVADARELEPPIDAVEEVVLDLYRDLTGAPRLGRGSNFFHAGGHSLSGAQFVARARRIFGVDLPLRSIFDAQTVAAFAARIRNARRGSSRAELSPRRSADPEVRAAPVQERLFFYQRLRPEDPAYNVPVVLSLRGPIRLAALESAIDSVVLAHAALRTRFEAGARGVERRVIPFASTPPSIVDLSGLRREDREAIGLRTMEAQALRSIDLGRGRLLDWTLVRFTPAEHRCLMRTHHIAADGSALGEILSGIGRAHAASSSGEPPPPLAPDTQYDDWVTGMHDWLASDAAAAEMAAWRTCLSDLPEEQPLPLDRPRPRSPTGKGASCRRTLSAALLSDLGTLARAEGATPFMAILAAYFVLMQRLSGSDDQWVGTALADHSPELEGVVGCFFNSVVVRTSLCGSPTFREIVRRVRDVALDAYDHGRVPFERVVEALRPGRTLSHAPIFQAMFVHQTRPLNPPALEGLEVSLDSLACRSPRLDLLFEVDPARRAIEVEFSLDVFDRSSVSRMLTMLESVMREVTRAPDVAVSGLSFLDARARTQIGREWNDSGREVDRPSLAGLLLEQARRTPDAIAVSDPERGLQLTYRDWERRTERYARELAWLGVSTSTPVGIVVRRSVELILALGAVVRAGGAFVALDPEAPIDRLRSMIDDAGVRLVIADPSSSLGRELDVEFMSWDPPERRSSLPIDRPPSSDRAPSYLLFTSGSTGRPKGALNTHAGFVNRLLWMQDRYRLGAGDAVLQKTPFTFDVSLWELFWPLCSGARLVLCRPGGHHDPAYLAELMSREQITLVHFVPSMLRALLGRVDMRDLRALRQVIVSGEALPPDLVAAFREASRAALDNLYGPTEAAIDVTAFPCREHDARVAIGRPITGVRMHVLSAEGLLEPLGAEGELSIGGIAPGLGYVNRGAVTALQFVPSEDLRVGRRYRTGDRARLLQDGNIDFLGRRDQQVKLRGLRIEPAEIEAALLEVDAIQEAAVGVLDAGAPEARLIAYVVAAQGIDTRALRSKLKERLPEYMVPGLFAVLEQMPTTASGKLDRKRLIGRGTIVDRGGGAPPSGPMELTIARVWRELLGEVEILRDSNFFELGGQSLIAIRTAMRLQSELGRPVELKTLFEAQTLRDLASELGRAEAIPSTPSTPAVRRAEDVPSLQQQRILFLEALLPGTSTYVMSGSLSLRGPLNVPALEAAIASLVAHHESLRTSFPRRAEKTSVEVADRLRLATPVVVTTRESAQELARIDSQTPFDLERGPLLRVHLFRVDEQEHFLAIAVHHAVADGWSLGIMLSHLSAAYASAARGEPDPHPWCQKTYRAYSRDQARWIAERGPERDLDYWLEALRGEPAPLLLPMDRPRPSQRTGRGGSKRRPFPSGLIRALESACRKEGVTPFMFFTAALDALLHKLTGAADVWLGTAVANRDDASLETVIGLFVNTVVLRTTVHGGERFSELLSRTRRTCIEAFDHQRAPFELVVEGLAPERDLTTTPLFQVMIVLEDAPETSMSIPSLEVRASSDASTAARFDLTFLVDARREEIELEYNADVFRASTADRILTGYLEVLDAAVSRPNARVRDLSAIPRRGRALALEAAFVDPGATAGAPIPLLFDESARRYAKLPAVSDGEATLTYAELHERVLQLEAALVDLGIARDTIVALLMGRSWRTLALMLAVMKAGAGFVAIDPSYPAARIRMMLEDAGCPLVVTDAPVARETVEGLEVVSFDRLRTRTGGLGRSRAGVQIGAGDLAYIIYTSGSTGRPKGAALRHGGASVLLEWARSVFGRAALERTLAATSFGFDLSIFELFAPLSIGAQVIIVPNLLEARSVPASALATLVNTVPSVAREALVTGRFDFSGKIVNLAGEALTRDLTDALLEAGAAAVWNLYGPTEDTTYSTATRVAGTGIVSIGRPLLHTGARVVDAEGEPRPSGAFGELFLGGLGLARGYVGRPSQTAERFVPATARSPGRREYRTGDLVRWSSAHELEYAGRLDRQVKLRGFRIELHEIEAAIESHPLVRHAVAQLVPREDGSSPLLAAWFVAREQRPELEQSLRAFLSDRLPAHFVPMAFVELRELPRLPSGKIDRKALPLPSRRSSVEGEAPRTPAEAMVADAFKQVLGDGEVGRESNFFDLGGHSFAATRVAARLSDRSGVPISLKDVFVSQTVGELAERIDRAMRTRALPNELHLDYDAEAAPLSFGEERTWILHQLAPEAPTYNLFGAFEIEGELNLDALDAVLQEIQRRHATLRTLYPERDGRPIARVRSFASPLNVVDARGGTPQDAERAMSAEASRPFDLARGPLFRTFLLIESDRHGYLFFNTHHIVADGRSLERIMREVEALYLCAVKGEPGTLGEPKRRYRDLAVAQRRWLESSEAEDQRRYWLEALQKEQRLELPADRAHPPRRSGRGGRCTRALPRSTVDGIHAIGRRLRATPFMVLAASLSAYLARLSRQASVRLGTVIADQRTGYEELVGLTINTVVLQTAVDPSRGFSRLVEAMRQATLEAHAHQEYPFEQVVETLQPNRDMSQTPLFQVAFVYQDAPPPCPALEGSRMERIDLTPPSSKFDLTLIVETGRWIAELEYNTDIFDPSTGHRMLDQWAEILGEMLREPERALAGSSFLGSRSSRQLVDIGRGPRARTKDGSAIDPFLERALVQPDAPAVTDGRTSLTYRALASRTARMAAALRELGVTTGTPVGVRVGRTVDMILATLAVVRAGGVYVAMDPAYPGERIRWIQEDSKAELVVVDREHVPLHAEGVHALTVPEIEALAREERPSAAPRTRAQDLIYITYTSGSSGRPKGVAVRHQGVLSLIDWARDHYDASAMRRVLASTSLCFDLSVYEIFVTLAIGGEVVLAENALAIQEVSDRETITLINTVPSSGQEMVTQDLIPRSVLVANFCGEPLPRSVCDRLYDLGVSQVWNLYGPSEDTTYSTAHLVVPHQPGPPSIGRVIRGSNLSIVDAEGTACPMGQAGSLRLGGLGLARGYIDRAAQTSQRFLPAPNDRHYDTGDLARWRQDGEVDFLGRRDSQVKVRGFRVELGEVEAVLEEHPLVAQAMVIADGKGAVERLFAYVVPSAEASDLPAELRVFLARKLPAHMVPDAVTVIHDPPRLPNGKVDRKRLPEPVHAPALLEPLRPDRPTEAVLAAIWSQVLEREPASADDDFFLLGGHSILATRLKSMVSRVFRIDLPLRAIFEHSTLRTMARAIESISKPDEVDRPIVRSPRGAEAPLTSGQERLWLLEQLAASGPPPYLATKLELSGELRPSALSHALREAVRRHEALRTTFGSTDGQPWQRVEQAPECVLGVVDLREIESFHRGRVIDACAQAEATRRIDLARGPLMRATLFESGAREHTLLAVKHHIVSDEWSVLNLMDEVEALDLSFSKGLPSTLPELEIQLVDYARWERALEQSARLERQRAYWAGQLHALTRDRLVIERLGSRPPRARYFPFTWPPELAARLSEFAKRQSVTPFMALMTALAVTVQRYSGRSEALIGTPVAGRSRSELEPLIGFFVNELVLRIDLDRAWSVAESLARVRATTLDAFGNQDLSYAEAIAQARWSGRADGPPITVHFDLHTLGRSRSSFAGLGAESKDIPPAGVQFPIQISMSLEAIGYVGLVGYDEGRFEHEDVVGFVEDFRTALLDLMHESVSSTKDVLVRGRFSADRRTRDASEEFQFE
jgi:amino acid adenylation domain-containing protein